MHKTTKKNYTFAVGRRKTAVARVRLYSGRGDTLVNGLPIATYFAGVAPEVVWNEPFSVTNTVGKYWATIKVAGGGKHGQVDAVRLGISRTLVLLNADVKTLLRQKGLLTRDPRQRERRKIGTGGKARRKKQSPKR